MPDPTLPDAELIEMAYDGICELEDPVTEIRDYGRTLLVVACCGDMVSRELSSVLYRLSCNIQKAYEQIEEGRGDLFRLLHPRRTEPGWSDRDPDDGNGEVEPAAGDAA